MSAIPLKFEAETPVAAERLGISRVHINSPQPQESFEAKRVRQSYKPTRNKLGRRDVQSRLRSALQNISAKEIAAATGESVAAAENAKSGRTGMSLTAFLNACREIPELQAMATELMGVPPVDADVERAISMLVSAKLRRG